MNPWDIRFIVSSSTAQPELDHLLRTILPAVHREEHGAAADYYFSTLGKSDYCRFRIEDSGAPAELMVEQLDKVCDSVSVLSLNTFLPKPRTTLPLLRLLLGEENGIIRDTWTTFRTSEFTVTTRTVEGFDFVVLDIETHIPAVLCEITTLIQDEFKELNITLLPEKRNDYEIFMQPHIERGV